VRLRELAFRWSDGPRWRVRLDAAQHAVIAPAGRSPRALRDALAALLYGPVAFPSGDPELRQAGLVFEVGGTLYQILADLVTGQRVLSVGGGAVADQPDAVDRRLAALLGLPDIPVFRAFALADVDLAAAPPDLPEGLQRQVLAHARAPDRLRAELAAAESRRNEAQQGRRPAATSLRRDAAFLGGLAGGAAATAAGWMASGGARLVALLGPVAYGVSAFRALQRVDHGEITREARDTRVDPEVAWRARARQLEMLDGQLAALEAAYGTRDPDALEAALIRGEIGPAASVRQRVTDLLGRAPAPSAIEGFRRGLPAARPAAATVAFVLAAALEEGAGFPLLWVAEGPLAAPDVDWTALYAGLGPTRPLLVFAASAPAAARPAPLESLAAPVPS
jgi:hypothetical protein